ncbi:dienelactone hydrolase family protein [Cellulomonas sp. PhB143]|uniref:dienelactone hydrolase family protein n=1 Tax=Cellulomonas sp. PhB143 TaxID=2485186 RepID=UPI000F4A64C7|nr:dienelactone hydrolase family protein [Cellulomonas sp. PhB143]ROS76631.1 dienelactone hydrolase [Cellulomonas sp. PhB143]
MDTPETRDPLDGWARGEHTADGVAHTTYRKGTGPGVVMIHELPGLTPECIRFGEEIVARGHTVVMPVLFGEAGAPASGKAFRGAVRDLCVSREFHAFALRRTSPVAGWLRSLARDLHDELGGPGVGAVGMCFTGGFALAMLADAPIAAPVLAQPSTPFPLGRRRAADLGLGADDVAAVRAKVAGGCQVLGVRYAGDRAVGTRFETLRRALGESFLTVEPPGAKHSTLTAHRDDGAVERVLDFFDEKLGVAGGQTP